MKQLVITFVTLFLMSCSGPTDEEIWFRKQVDKCFSMNSRYFYDKDTKEFKCYRTPFMRKPILMFEERYTDEQSSYLH